MYVLGACWPAISCVFCACGLFACIIEANISGRLMTERGTSMMTGRSRVGIVGFYVHGVVPSPSGGGLSNTLVTPQVCLNALLKNLQIEST